MYPDELLYTKEHEWVRLEGSMAEIGITDHAQKELGDIVFVELPKVGTKVTAAESFGTIESVKAVSDIYSPVTGVVIAVNGRLQNAPELVNSDPHGDAWLIQVKLVDRAEADSLMSAEQYEAYLKGEAAH